MLNRFLTELRKRINTPETVTAPWTLVLAGGFVVMYLIIFFTALIFVSTLSDADLSSPEPDILAYTSLLAGLLMLGLTIQYTENSIARARAEKKKLPSYGEVIALVPSKNTPIWIVLLSAFAIATVLDVIGFSVGVSETSLPMPLDGLPQSDALPFIVGVLAVMLIQPITQELIFRGVLYTTLIKQTTHIQAIIISTVLFTALHLLLDTQLWWGLVYPLVLGLTAGIARSATQSTQAAIGTHMMFGIFIVLRALIL